MDNYNNKRRDDAFYFIYKHEDQLDYARPLVGIRIVFQHLLTHSASRINKKMNFECIQPMLSDAI